MKPPIKAQHCAPQSTICIDDHWPHDVEALKLFAINLSFICSGF